MVHRMPLMNILATGVDEPSAVLAIVDCKFLAVPFFDIFKSRSYPCLFVVVSFGFFFFFQGTKHLVEGSKKNASYIASLFEPWIQKLDPTGVRVDCVFLWSKQCPKGRSNSCGRVPLHSCSNLCCSFGVPVLFGHLSETLGGPTEAC
jgi:hypothetical protein